ncbi:MAG: tyrosine recombinase XerC [Nitrospinota bacterium]|nr:tyrosine recombinase XerC [Nitrospinota bacterium]
MEQVKIPKEIEKFLTHISIEKGFSPKTSKAYGKDLAQFAEFAFKSPLVEKKGTSGAIDFEKMEVIAVRSFVAELHRKKLAPSSIERKLSALRAFFRYLAREGMVEKNIAEAVPLPKKPKKMPKFLSVDEAFALMDSADKGSPTMLRDRAMLELFYSSGLRIAELQGLNAEDVDLTGNLVRVMGKGSKERIIPVGKKAAVAIRELMKSNGKDSGPLFYSRLKKRLSMRQTYEVVVKHGIRAGIIKRLTPHMIRHTFATHMLNGGADLRAIQELLGHSSLGTTEKYTHVGIERLMNVYDSAHPHARKRRGGG